MPAGLIRSIISRQTFLTEFEQSSLMIENLFQTKDRAIQQLYDYAI